MILEQKWNFLFLGLLIVGAVVVGMVYKSYNSVYPNDFEVKKEIATVNNLGNEFDQDDFNNIDPEKVLAIGKLLDKSYDSLYESRIYFDSEIIKLHKASKDLTFLWHPDQEKQGYTETMKKSGNVDIKETIIDANNYKITITSHAPQSYTFEDDITDTHIVITNNGKLIDTRNFSGLIFSHIYKIKVNQTFYYIIGLCTTGTHGCGMLVPMINDGDKLVIGEVIKGVDFSNYLRIEDFFIRNGELYTVFDDSRYFFGYYSTSNNASYNSAVPRIFKFDRATGDVILVTNSFLDLYKKSVQIISDDLIKLKDSIPEKIRHTIPKIDSSFLAPYFDYYLGMAIIADPTHSSETRKEVEKLYLDFFGKQNKPEVNFDGYKDFER